jgi:hypothetical protein
VGAAIGQVEAIALERGPDHSRINYFRLLTVFGVVAGGGDRAGAGPGPVGLLPNQVRTDNIKGPVTLSDPVKLSVMAAWFYQ